MMGIDTLKRGLTIWELLKFALTRMRHMEIGMISFERSVYSCYACSKVRATHGVQWLFKRSADRNTFL